MSDFFFDCSITITFAVLSYTFDVVSLLRACSHDPRKPQCPGAVMNINYKPGHFNQIAMLRGLY